MRSFAPRRLQVLPNLTPLVDISLLLIVVFLAAVPLIAHPLPLKLSPVDPKVSDKGLPAGQVVVRAYGSSLTVNGVEVSEDKLLATLKTALAGEEVVILDAGLEQDYGRVVTLLDLFRQAGAKRVGLAPDLSSVLGAAASADVTTSANTSSALKSTEVTP